jgi:hypothetical protein
MSASAIRAELSLDTTPFASAFSRVRALVSGTGSRLAALWPMALGAGAAAFAGIAAGAVGVKKALDLGGELADLSAQTGLAAGELLTLQQAFKNNGLAAEDVGTSINKMQKSIVDGSDAFGRMGVDLESLKGQSASEQFKTIGQAIDGIADPAQRTAAAMEVFGKSGGKMLTIFADGGALALAAEEVGSQAEMLSRDAALFDDISDKLSLAGQKAMGFFVGVADKVAPVIGPMLDRFVSLDLAKYGQAIGEGIAFVIQALSDGKLSSILLDSAKIAFANAINFLAGGLAGVALGLGQAMLESVRNSIELFRIVTTGDFWAGVGNALQGIAKGFIASLLEGVAALLESLKSVPFIGGKVGSGGAVLRGAAAGIRSSGEADKGQAADLLGPLMERMKNRVADAAQNIGDAASKGFKSGSGLIDTSEWQAHMDAAIGGVMANAEKAGETARAGVKEKPKTGVLAEDDSKKKKGVAFADNDRRLGLGGRAYYNPFADPEKKAKDDQRKSFDKLTTTVTDLTKELQKRPERIVAVVPKFQ